MKRILSLLAAAGTLIPMTYGADQYSVFKICEDKHVIHTSDGADAGHIEYIITDPAQQQIVSAICTGGVLADRLIQVPFNEFAYGDGNEVTINFDRQRLVSAPVIEQNVLISGARLDPGIVQRSVTYFGGGNTRTGQADRGAADRGNTRNQPAGEARTEPGSRNAPGAVSTDPNAQPREGQPPATRGDQRNPGNLKATEGRNGDVQKEERGARTAKPQTGEPRAETSNEKTPPTTRSDNENGSPKTEGRSGAAVKGEETRTAKPQTGEPKAETSNEKTPPTARTDNENGSPKTEARSGAAVKGEEKPERSTERATRPESRTPSEPAKAGTREGTRTPEKGEVKQQ